MKKTLLLIPGFGANEKAWSHQTEYLKELYDIRVITMDRQLSRKEMVEDLLESAPAKFFIAGQSMGGWIAQAVAATASQRVEKLIILNTWCSPDPKLNEVQYQLMTALEQGDVEKIFSQHIPLVVHPSRLEDSKLLSLIQSMFMSFPVPTLAHQLHAMMIDYDSLALLPKIQAETLIVHSREDALFSLNEQQRLHSGIKRSKLAIIEECGHGSILEQPNTVTALMRLFLEYG